MTPADNLTARIGGAEGNDAGFSQRGDHRFFLSRHVPDLILDRVYGRLLYVMLNPSKADAETNDMTISKCIGFAKGYGATRIGVVNLFSRISTDPGGLLGCADRNVELSDTAIRAALLWLKSSETARHVSRVVFAHGKPSWPKRSPIWRDFGERVLFARNEALMHGF